MNIPNPYAGEPLDFSKAGRARSAAQHRSLMLLMEYLVQPPKRVPRLDDHQPWNVATETCGRCGISALEFHARNGVPCVTDGITGADQP